MVKPKVYVTRILPPPGLEILKKYCDIEVYPEKFKAPPKDVIIEHVRDKDALLCLLTDKIDKDVIESAPNLRVISTCSAGFDHIDLETATKRGIYVTNTPGVLTEAVADFTWALILAIARRIIEADKTVREGRWNIPWSPEYMLGSAIHGKVLGIVGMGKIGTAVARRSIGFNMKVIYYSRTRKTDIERELNAKYVSLEELLKTADIISLHVPLTKETYHLIGERELKMMKKTAFLINTARGAVVDEKVLVRALKEKWIAGAALDVFEKEPVDPNNPLLKLENVVLAPHIGSATWEARSKMAEISAINLINVLMGKEPLYFVNPEVKKIRPLEKVKMI